MKVSVALFTQDCEAWRLESCLNMYSVCSPAPHEILVIDYESTLQHRHEYRKIIDKYGSMLKIVFIETRSPNGDKLFHPARLANTAITESTGDILVYSDVDILVERYAFRYVQEAFSENPYRVLMCSRLDMPETKPEIYQNLSVINGFNNVWQLGGGEANHAAQGSFLCLPKRWLQQVGGFNEEFIGWGSYDVDMHRRAKMAGLEEVWLDKRGLKILHMWHEKRPYRGVTNMAKNATLLKESKKVVLEGQLL